MNDVYSYFQQTLCPYALKPLSEAQCNGEHILPRALGAPESFTIPAYISNNNDLNIKIDVPAIHDPLLKILAIQSRVESRSGGVSMKIKGTDAASGLPVTVTLDANSTNFKYDKPVERNGNKVTIRGFGDDARKLAEQMRAGIAKKGMTFTEVSREEHSTAGAEGQLTCEWPNVLRLLIKTAYLASVKQFGDKAILSQVGVMLRELMLIDDPHTLMTKISEYRQQGSAIVFMCPLGESQLLYVKPESKDGHAITCYITPDNGLLLHVDFFDFFSLLVMVKHQDILPLGQIPWPLIGSACTINASSQKLTIFSQEQLVQYLINQVMRKNI